MYYCRVKLRDGTEKYEGSDTEDHCVTTQVKVAAPRPPPRRPPHARLLLALLLLRAVQTVRVVRHAVQLWHYVVKRQGEGSWVRDAGVRVLDLEPLQELASIGSVWASVGCAQPHGRLTRRGRGGHPLPFAPQHTSASGSPLPTLRRDALHPYASNPPPWNPPR